MVKDLHKVPLVVWMTCKNNMKIALNYGLIILKVKVT